MNSPGRLLNILDYSLSALKRKFLKNLAVFCLFSLVVFLFSSFHLLNKALTEAASRTLATAPDITVQQMSAGRQESIPVSAKHELSSIFGITKIKERIWGYYFDESNGANYTVLGMQTLADKKDKEPWLELATGRMLKQEERGAVVIGESLRDHLQLGDRKFFSLFKPDLSLMSFETVGVFDKEWDIVTADLLLMSMEDARILFAIPSGFVTDLLVYVANPSELETIGAKIADKLPSTRVITRNQILKTYTVVFSWRSGFGMICLLTALAAFIIFAWDKASGLSQEEMREVGILKILGWQTQDIILLRFSESITLSLLAFLTGYFLSWVHVVFFDGLLFRPVFLGWSVVRPVFQLVPSFDFTDMLLIFSISVVPYLCATAVPAWRAAVVRAESVI